MSARHTDLLNTMPATMLRPNLQLNWQEPGLQSSRLFIVNGDYYANDSEQDPDDCDDAGEEEDDPSDCHDAALPEA